MSDDRTFVFADLAGYTALTEAHGDHDAARVATRLHELARGCLPAGTVLVKTIGDAVMLVAPTIGDGVTVALELARIVAAEPAFPALRVGLHVGPVIERDHDFFGATVNIAARVAGVARAGEIVCTAPVALVAGELELAAAQPLGTIRLKNVAAPVELYRLSSGSAADELRHLDPVCRMQITAAEAAATTQYASIAIYFCSAECARKFEESPEAYVPVLGELVT